MSVKEFTIDAINNVAKHIGPKLKSNEAIERLAKVQGSLLQHAGGVGWGTAIGAGYGAYQGATDGYRDPLTGAVIGGAFGAVKGGALGYGGSFGWRMFTAEPTEKAVKAAAGAVTNAVGS